MLVIVTYDIEKDKKRTRLHKKLKDFGPRVQYSVFEADITREELEKMDTMLSKIKLDDNDSIRLYTICETCKSKIKIWGQGEITEDKDIYIA